MEIDHRVRALVRDNKGTRLHILLVLWAMPGPATAQEIAAVINCNRDTIGDLLPRMAADGYIASIGAGRHPRWTLTDKSRQLPLPNLIGDAEKFRVISSSSSDLYLPPALDQNQTEEEESTAEERTRLVDDYRLTGTYRTTVLSDPWITRRRFEAWYRHAEKESKRSPAAYAVTCCQNHDEPPEERSAWAQDAERYRQRAGR